MSCYGTHLIPAWAAFIVISLRIACAGAVEPALHTLQGYGLVSLEVPATAGGPAVFRCEDDAAADRLLSKLLADFSWDRLTGPRQQKLSQARLKTYPTEGAALPHGRCVVTH